MKRVLVTGMSGTGKSTLLAELADRGHWTVDTDYGDYVEVVDGEPLWIEARLDDLLSREDPRGLLVVAGTVRNQVTFYPRFDQVVLLSAPEQLMVERLRARTGNSFGRSPDEMAAVLADLAEVEPLLRASATLEIVTTMPVADVADAVLATSPDGQASTKYRSHR